MSQKVFETEWIETCMSREFSSYWHVAVLSENGLIPLSLAHFCLSENKSHYFLHLTNVWNAKSTEKENSHLFPKFEGILKGLSY